LLACMGDLFLYGHESLSGHSPLIACSSLPSLHYLCHVTHPIPTDRSCGLIIISQHQSVFQSEISSDQPREFTPVAVQ
jgi:hypothetical protein